MDFVVEFPLTLREAEKGFLRVSPMKGMKRFGRKDKLSPWYIGPFEVLERVGEMSYRLAFPPILSGVNSVLHVSMLRKYFEYHSHVLNFSSVQLDENLAYVEELVAILDRQVQKLKLKDIALMKVQWRDRPVKKATWDIDHDMKSIYPYLFSTLDMILYPFKDEHLFK
ncbi:uncharacterized protein [Nicotiana tomentosiformis]|uniref:uncharacterized protein n=1 Tax=Nicotiana tomentosiformis TaxID=4098 RepID=UPI00388C9E0C